MFENRVFKFRSWLNDFDIRLLTHNEIFLSSAEQFNDPFDCNISVKYDGLTKEDVIQRNIKFLKTTRPELGNKKIKKLAKKQEQIKFYKDKNHLKWFDEYQKDYNLKHFGIYSLAGNCDNIVMWSHYANSHKGVCFGFNIVRLGESFPLIAKQHGLLIDIYPVIYSTEYPTYHIKDLDLDAEQRIVKPLITKSSAWEYENEYRLISLSGVNFSLHLYDGIITEIILGCKISHTDKNMIQRILRTKKSNIKLYQALMDDNDFNLKFEEINYLKAF